MEDFDRPQRSRQAEASKAFLMKNSSNSNMNLYDHLTHLLTKVMDEHPNNAVDVFEEMSYEVKRASLNSMQSNLRDLPQLTATELLAEQQRSLFLQSDNEPLDDETGKPVLPNVNEISFYLEQAEVGLGREEMQRIFLALKKLVDSERLTHCRFWGKILGIENNYIVAEAENRGGEEKDHYTIEDELKEQIKGPESLEKEPFEGFPLPYSAYKPQHEVPKEAIGIGANKFAYYVCKEPGLPWVKLPSVTPAQITIARQIRKFFTGNLDKSVVSYPPFPGNEANYLRAQIARISAATQVSPYGSYQTVGDEGEEEQELYWASIEVNPDFEGVPVHELAESLKVWVHHRQHILQQGRCTWENMAEKTGEDTNEETEDEREEELDEPEPEVGPRLLNPLSLDAEMFNMPPWSSRLSSHLTPEHAIAVLRSNLWPGAFAYSSGKKFENIYIGWGLKYIGEVYSPPIPPLPQKEYPDGPEITEALDPTPEEELDFKDNLEEQQAALEESEESEESEEDDN
ncbi:radial spoke head protein 4 homolog A [Cyprinodon tularosa]|uniref:radial spoke head protein 4 homolog A n=1 Tax=Cyprinodon tularosa TaxID=77115 RepID=UPI0018E24386|nr:radial spoke head protein 4 homolog A [Cyprinodon tularosa]